MKLTKSIITIILFGITLFLAADVATTSSVAGPRRRIKTTISCDGGAGCIEDITFPAMHLSP